MNITLKSFSVFLILSLTGCSASRVATDQAKSMDFTKYHTYAWMPEDKDRKLKNEFIESKLKETVESRLNSMGYTKTGSSMADLLLGYSVKINDNEDIYSLEKSSADFIDRDYISSYSIWNFTPIETQKRAVKMKEGTLILRAYDGKTKNLVWRGSRTGEVYKNTTTLEKSARITGAANNIMDSFPADTGR